MVTANNRGGLSGESGRQYDVVITIATRVRFKQDGRDKGERFLEQPSSCQHIRRALTKLSSQYIA